MKEPIENMRIPTTRIRNKEGRVLTINSVDKDNPKYKGYKAIGESNQEPIEVKTTPEEEAKLKAQKAIQEKISALPNIPSIIAFTKEEYGVEITDNPKRPEAEAAAYKAACEKLDL